MERDLKVYVCAGCEFHQQMLETSPQIRYQKLAKQWVHPIYKKANKTSKEDFYEAELAERIHKEGDFVRLGTTINLEFYAYMKEKEKFWYKGEMLT